MALKKKSKESVMRKPYRAVFAGPGGLGKSTAAGTIGKKAWVIDLDKRWPKSLIARNEFADVQETFKGVKDHLNEILSETKLEYDLIVIDTCTKLMTFIESWTIQQDCKGDKDKYSAYGHGLKFAHQYFQEILDLLDKIQEKHQVNIVFVCHTKLKPFKTAVSGEDYIKNQLDLPDIVADRLKQWADCLAFMYFEVPVDDKHKAKGPAKRYVTLQDAPIHDAKNGLPWALPEKIDLDMAGRWAELVFSGSYPENRELVTQIEAFIEAYPATERDEIRTRFDHIGFRGLDSKKLQEYLAAAQAAKKGGK